MTCDLRKPGWDQDFKSSSQQWSTRGDTPTFTVVTAATMKLDPSLMPRPSRTCKDRRSDVLSYNYCHIGQSWVRIWDLESDSKTQMMYANRQTAYNKSCSLDVVKTWLAACFQLSDFTAISSFCKPYCVVVYAHWGVRTGLQKCNIWHSLCHMAPPHVTRNAAQNTRPYSTLQGGSGNETRLYIGKGWSRYTFDLIGSREKMMVKIFLDPGRSCDCGIYGSITP